VEFYLYSDETEFRLLDSVHEAIPDVESINDFFEILLTNGVSIESVRPKQFKTSTNPEFNHLLDIIEPFDR
jgi:hypothetical protein